MLICLMSAKDTTGSIEMDIINKIYAMPITKTKLMKMRETEQSKLRTVTDGKKMHQIFVEDLRKK